MSNHWDNQPKPNRIGQDQTSAETAKQTHSQSIQEEGPPENPAKAEQTEEKLTRPSLESIEGELARLKRVQARRKRALIVSGIVVVLAAVAVLVAMRWFPVLQIRGISMEPSLQAGDVIVVNKLYRTLECGDIIAFYNGNELLVKRVIGVPGDVIDMDEDGDVYINGIMLDEPYLEEKSPGISDMEFPVAVPDDSYFVLGDHRQSALDSRIRTVGFVSNELIMGKLIFRIRFS